MADAVTIQTLHDGDRHAVMLFNNVSDGTGESAVLKVDVSALTPRTRDNATCTGVSIESIRFQVAGMSVSVLWDATTDVVAAVLSGENYLCYSTPLANNAGAGKTGDILFSTVGHTAGDTYSIELMLRKKYG